MFYKGPRSDASKWQKKAHQSGEISRLCRAIDETLLAQDKGSSESVVGKTNKAELFSRLAKWTYKLNANVRSTRFRFFFLPSTFLFALLFFNPRWHLCANNENICFQIRQLNSSLRMKSGWVVSRMLGQWRARSCKRSRGARKQHSWSSFLVSDDYRLCAQYLFSKVAVEINFIGTTESSQFRHCFRSRVNCTLGLFNFDRVKRIILHNEIWISTYDRFRDCSRALQ